MIRDNYEVRRDIERRKDDVEADVKKKSQKKRLCKSGEIFQIQSKVDTSRNHVSVELTCDFVEVKQNLLSQTVFDGKI